MEEFLVAGGTISNAARYLVFLLLLFTMLRNTKVLAGSSHPELASLVSKRLATPLADTKLKKFSNKETSVEIGNWLQLIALLVFLTLSFYPGVSIRNEDVFIIQSGSQDMNDNIIELCIMIQAARIGSAKRVTAVLPYFPYCKQSKRKGRTCITAKCKWISYCNAFLFD